MGLLPEGFEDLEVLAPRWAVATEAERQAVRRNCTSGELRGFYDTLLPRLQAVLDAADGYPLGEMPPDVEQLFLMALSLAEVAPHVELYDSSPSVPYAFEETRFNAIHDDRSKWKRIGEES